MKFSYSFSRKVDGNFTLFENIADNVGVKAALQAYESWATENGDELRLPGLQQYSSRAMFWIAAAQSLCSEGCKFKFSINHPSKTIYVFIFQYEQSGTMATRAMHRHPIAFKEWSAIGLSLQMPFNAAKTSQ